MKRIAAIIIAVTITVLTAQAGLAVFNNLDTKLRAHHMILQSLDR